MGTLLAILDTLLVCLVRRYGESLAQTREAGWLCPHCYEKEHGKEHGWFCNRCGGRAVARVQHLVITVSRRWQWHTFGLPACHVCLRANKGTVAHDTRPCCIACPVVLAYAPGIPPALLSPCALPVGIHLACR